MIYLHFILLLLLLLLVVFLVFLIAIVFQAVIKKNKNFYIFT